MRRIRTITRQITAATRRLITAALDRMLPAHRIGSAILQARNHHLAHPDHGRDCACLDTHAGTIRRIAFSTLPHDRIPANSLPSGDPDPAGSHFSHPTPLSRKRIAAVQTVLSYLLRD